MTRHEQILLAMQALLIADPFFPPDTALDAPEPSNWRKNIPGVVSALSDHATVQDGPVEVTRDGGAQNDWELELEMGVVYAVQGAVASERRSRRDQAAEHVAAIIRAARDLGLQDPQVYAEIKSIERDDEVPVEATAPVALSRITVCVQFIADSPAG